MSKLSLFALVMVGCGSSAGSSPTPAKPVARGSSIDVGRGAVELPRGSVVEMSRGVPRWPLAGAGGEVAIARVTVDGASVEVYAAPSDLDLAHSADTISTRQGAMGESFSIGKRERTASGAVLGYTHYDMRHGDLHEARVIVHRSDLGVVCDTRWKRSDDSPAFTAPTPAERLCAGLRR